MCRGFVGSSSIVQRYIRCRRVLYYNKHGVLQLNCPKHLANTLPVCSSTQNQCSSQHTAARDVAWVTIAQSLSGLYIKFPIAMSTTLPESAMLGTVGLRGTARCMRASCT